MRRRYFEHLEGRQYLSTGPSGAQSSSQDPLALAAATTLAPTSAVISSVIQTNSGQSESSFAFAGFTFTPSGGVDATSLDKLLHGTATAAVAFAGTVSIASGASISLSGTFSVGSPSGTFNVTLSSLAASLPNNIVTVNSNSGSLTLSSSGFSGNINGLNVASSTGISLNGGTDTFNWSGSGADKDVLVGVNNVTLGVYTPTQQSGTATAPSSENISVGSLTFEQSGGNVSVALSSASVSLGDPNAPLVSVTSLNGNLLLSTAGISGSINATVAANFSSEGANFSGTLGLQVDTTHHGDASFTATTDPSLKVTGTAMTATIPGVGSFGGNFAFEEVSQEQTLVALQVTGLTVSLGSSGDGASLTGPANYSSAPNGQDYGGSFVLTPATTVSNGTAVPGSFAGIVAGTFATSAPGISSVSGTAVLMVNTGTTPQDFADPLASATDFNNGATITVPAGPFFGINAENLNLTLTSGTTMSGGFSFTASGSGGSAVLAATATNVSVTAGAATLTNGAGTLTFGSGGISGSLSGNATLNIGGGTASGTFAFSFNNGIATLTGTNLSLPILGQTITGDFSISVGGGQTTFTTAVGATNDDAVVLAGGMLKLANLQGSFFIDTSASPTVFSASLTGTLAIQSGNTSFSGTASVAFTNSTITVSGSSDTLTVGQESITGGFSFAATTDANGLAVAITLSNINGSFGNGLVDIGGGPGSTGASGSLTIDSTGTNGGFSAYVTAGTATGVSFAGQIALSVTPGSIVASGMGDTLTIPGANPITADFKFSEDATGLALAVSNVNFSLGGGALTVNSGAGTVHISSTGVTGSFSAAVASTLSNVSSFSGNLTLNFAPGTLSFTLSGALLTVEGQTISGDLALTVTNGGSSLSLTSNDLTASLGSGLVTITPPSAGAQTSSLTISNGSINGAFTGNVTAGKSTSGFNFSGPITVSLAGSVFSASGTGDTLTVAGQQITGGFNFTVDAASKAVSLGVSNVSFSIGTILAVHNASVNLTLGSTGVSGSSTGGTFTAAIGGFAAGGSLEVGFAPGSIYLIGTGDTLSFGDESLTGDFNFTKDSTGVHLSATNFTAKLAAGLVTVANGSGSLNIDAGTGAVSGSISGTVMAGTNSGSFSFSGTVSATVGSGAITVTGTGDTLTVGSVTIPSISFNFSEQNGNLQLGVSGASFTLGTYLSVTGASGTLSVTAAGISGTTSGTVTSTVAGLSGTIGVGFAPGSLTISGTNDSLAFGNQTLMGDFAFSLASSTLDLSITNLVASLGGGLVTVGGAPNSGTGASATLQLSGSTFTGAFDGYVTAGTASGVAFAGEIAVSIAAGAITASSTDPNTNTTYVDTVTIAGQTISGSFAFSEDSSKTLDLAISNVNFTAGPLSVTNVNGTLTVGPAGIAGQVSGTLQPGGIPGLSGTFGIGFGNNSISLSGTGDSLTIGGQTLSGDFTFVKNASGLTLSSGNLSASLGGGLVTITGGSANLAVTNAGAVSGSFSGTVAAGSATSGFSFGGQLSVVVAPGSISATGTNDVLSVAGYQLAANLAFSYAAGTLSLNISSLNFTLGGALTISNASGMLTVASTGVSGSATGTVTSNFSGFTVTGTLGVAFAPGTISVSGKNDQISYGGESISGDFTFTQSAGNLSLSASNFAASLGGGLVTVTQASGSLNVAGGQINGSFTGTIGAGSASGVSFSGPIAVSVTPGGISAMTPQGSTPDTLTVAGQAISGFLAFSDSTASGLQIGVTGLNFSLPGAVALTNGAGMLSVGKTGVSGSVSGTIATSFTAASFSGTLALSFAPGTFSLSGTNDMLTFGDQTLSGDFTFLKDQTGLHLSAANFAASFGGGLVTISNGSGSLNIVNGAFSGNLAGTVAAGSAETGASFSGAILLAFAPGSISASTPTGQTDTLSILGNTLSAGFNFSEDANGLELGLTGINLSLGGGAVSVTNAGGTVHVSKSGITGSINGSLAASIPGVTFNTSNFAVAFAPGTLSVSGTGVGLTVGGQTITGDFAFSSLATGVDLKISNLGLSLGGVVNVTNGQGEFTLTKGTGGGISGSASGTIAVSGGSNVSFGGSFGIAVNNSGITVSGTGDSLTVFGQTLSGNFSFTKNAGGIDLHVDSLNLGLGGGLVTVTGGAADFEIANGAITGSASGTLGIGAGLSGVSFVGNVAVTLGATNISVSATNAQLILGGATLSGNLVFSDNLSTGSLQLAVSNLTLMDSGTGVVVSGTLLVGSTGLSGTVTGTLGSGSTGATVTATFGNGTYVFSVGVSTSFAETIGGASISGTVAAGFSSTGTGQIGLTNLNVSLGNGLITVTGGTATFNYDGHNISGTATGTLGLGGALSGIALSGTVTLTITNGATTAISVEGTNVSLSILNQTLAGDFGFFAPGDGTIQITGSQISLSLANSISLTNGSVNLVLGSTGAAKGIKGTGSANLAVGFTGFSFTGAFGLAIDTTNGQSNFTISANPITLNIGNQSITGAFVVEKTTTSKGLSTISIAISNVQVTLGNASTYLQISNGHGTLLFLPGGGVALDVGGSVALIGVTGLTLNGSLDVRVNTTATAVNQTYTAPDPNNPGQNITQTLTIGASEDDISGAATLAVGDGSGNTFVSLSGGFTATKTTTTAGSATTTELILAAAGLNAFLGTGENSDGTLASNAVGVQVINASLGVAVFSTPGSATTYALAATGAAALIGVPGLTLSGSLSVESDTDGAFSTTVQVPDPKNPGTTIPVPLSFTQNIQAFAGSVSLGIADPNNAGQQFVSVAGNFAFSKQTSGGVNTLTISANSVNAFFGSGGGGANAIGLQISNGGLGLVINTPSAGGSATYALDATGGVALVGLPGLLVSGNLTVQASNVASGSTLAVPDPANPGQTIAVGSGITATVSGLNFSILDTQQRPVLSITVTATLSENAGLLDINATSVDFFLAANGSKIIDVQGNAEFTVGSGGFALGADGFNVTGFTLFGTATSTQSANSIVSAAMTSPGVASTWTTPAAPNLTATTSAQTSTTPLPTITPPVGAKVTTLGPLAFSNLKPIFKNFSFSGGLLSADIGLSAAYAALNVGKSTGGSTNNASGVSAAFSNVSGDLNLAVGVDLHSFRVTSFGSSGAFNFSAQQFVLNIPNIVNVNATNVAIGYDPKADNTQQLLSIGSAIVTVPLSSGNSVQGGLTPFTDSTGKTIPGLVVWGDHFQLGTAFVKYNGTLSLGSAVSIVNPSVQISNFGATFDGSVNFNGSISIAADSATIGSGKFGFTATGVSATLDDSTGTPDFKFKAASLDLKLSVVDLSATNVFFDPTASTSTQPLVSFQQLTATVNVASLTISGSAGSLNPADMLTIYGDGSVHIPADFTIDASLTSGSAGGLGLPSFIPFQIQGIALTWPDLADDPSNFTINLSASVNGSLGPIQVSGSVTDMVIDVNKLVNGEFPITSIGEASIGASGNVFGGTISGQVILGTVGVDASGASVSPGDPSAVNSYFYVGVEGGFDFAGEAGFQIRFGVSTAGPLDASIYVNAPIEIFPPADLAITSFYGGIQFDVTPLPSISNATDLKSPLFTPGSQLTDAQWAAQLPQQVINQVTGGAGGYLFSINQSLQSQLSADTSSGVATLSATDPVALAFQTNNYPLQVINNANDAAHNVANPGDQKPFNGQLTTTVSPVKNSSGQTVGWIITDGVPTGGADAKHPGSAYYLVQLDQLTGKLDVSQFRFALDPNISGQSTSVTKAIAALTAGQVNTDLQTIFANFNIQIPNSATVATNPSTTPGAATTSWTITNGSFRYTVKQVGTALVVTSSGGSMNSLNVGIIRIEAAATLGFGGIPQGDVSITGDITIETDGKILIDADAVFGATTGANGMTNYSVGESLLFRAYVDLSHVSDGDASLLFYFEQDANIGSISFPQLIIAGGVTFGQTDAGGNFLAPGTTAGAAGFGVKVTGLVSYSINPLITLTLTGDASLVFVKPDFTLTFDAQLSATLAQFIKVNNFITAAGVFVFQTGPDFEIWGAAQLQLSGNDIPLLQEAGISIEADAFLRINTDSAPHTVDLPLVLAGTSGGPSDISITLEAGSFGLYLVGELVFNKGPVEFDLDGVFDIDFDTQPTIQFNVFVFADLHLGIAGLNIFKFDALGLLIVNDQGVAAELSVSTSGGIPHVLEFSADFDLFLNTTGEDQQYTLPGDLISLITQVSAGSGGYNGNSDLDGSLMSALDAEFKTLPGVQTGVDSNNNPTITLNISGAIPMLDSSNQITGHGTSGPYLIIEANTTLSVLDTFNFVGQLFFSASPDGVDLAVNAELNLGSVLTVAASGVFDISDEGVVAGVTLASDFSLGGIIDFSGAASFELNTTDKAQTVKLYTYDPGSGNVSSTLQDVTIPAATSAADPFILVDVQGKMSLLAHGLTLQGHFIFENSAEGLNVEVSASLDVFNTILSFNGGVLITPQGDVALYASATLALNTFKPLFDLGGTVAIVLNTSTSGLLLHYLDANGVQQSMTINGSYFNLGLAGYVDVLGAHVDVSADLQIDNGFTSVNLQANASFFGLATLHFYAYFDSNGDYAVAFGGGFDINAGIADLNGGAWICVSDMPVAPIVGVDSDFNITGLTIADYDHGQNNGPKVFTLQGNGHVGGSIAGGLLGGSVDIGFYFDSNLTIKFDVHLTITILWGIHIHVNFTVNLGNILGGQTPPVIYLAGDAANSQVLPSQFPGGQLILDVGTLDYLRNALDPTDNNETISLTANGAYNAASGQSVIVEIDGYTQTFNNVTSIIVPGNGGETLTIGPGVAVPIEATVGSQGTGNVGGKIYDNGSGPATLAGGLGNDLIEAGTNAIINPVSHALTFSGPTPAPESITGGGGNDTIIAGTGVETINTNPGSTGGHSLVIWDADISGAITWAAVGPDDTFDVNINNPAVTADAHGERFTVIASTTNPGDALFTGGDGNSALVGVSTAVVSAMGGGNKIVVSNLAATSLHNLLFSYGASHASGNAAEIDGSAGNDSFTLTDGQQPLPGSTAATTYNTAIVTEQGGVTIQFVGTSAATGDGLTLNGKGGNDNFYITSLNIPTIVSGNDSTAVGGGATSSQAIYYVGYQNGQPGSLAGIAGLLTINGAPGMDTAIIDDTGDYVNHLFTLTASALLSDAFGAGGQLAYAAVENLSVEGGAGNNSYTIKGTSATTSINGGIGDDAFTVAAPLAAALSINGQGSSTGQDFLTVVGTSGANNGDGTVGNDSFVIANNSVTGAGATVTFANLNGLTVNGNGGNDSFILNGDSTPTTLIGGSGNDTFTVNGDSAPTTLLGSVAPLTGAGTPGYVGSISTANTATVAADLNSGNIDSILQAAFSAGGSPLKSPATDAVVTDAAGSQWRVFDNNIQYLIVRQSNGTLSINNAASQSAGTDTFNINGNSALLNIQGYFGNDTFNVNSNANTLNLYGGTGTDTYIVNANAGTLALVSPGGKANVNNVSINSNTGSLSVNTNNAGGTFTIGNIVSGVTVNTGTGPSTYYVTGPLRAPLNLIGSPAGVQNLVVTGTAAADTFNITTTSITGFGSAITYSGLMSITIYGNGGNDTFNLNGNDAATSLIGGLGHETFNITSITSPVTIDTSNSLASTINLGNNNVLLPLASSLVIKGSGLDTLNLNDSADTVSRTAVLTDTTLNGLSVGPNGITYGGLSIINMNFGSGSDTVTIVATAAGSTVNVNTNGGNDTVIVQAIAGSVNVNTGTGVDTIDVGSGGSAGGGTLAGIAGTLKITGSGQDTLNLDDSGDTLKQTGTLTAAALSGLGLASPVAFTGVQNLNLLLGNGGNTLAVNSTAPTTITSIHGGSGNDTFNVTASSGTLLLQTGSGANTISLGSLAPATGGTLAGLTGPVSVTGGGIDTLNLDDSGDNAATSASLTAGHLSGLDLGIAGIAYAGIANLNLTLGNGAIVFNLLGTSAVTTVNLGVGNDTINLMADNTKTTINAGGGTDVANVQSTGAATAINLGGGADTINVGSLAPATGGTLAGIHGPLTLAGTGAGTLNFDDTGDKSTATGALSSTTVTGFGTAGIDYSGYATAKAVNLNLGNAGNNLTIAGTLVGALTTINTGSGSDAVTVQNTNGTTNLNTGGGNDTVNVQGISAATTINTGTGTNTVNVSGATNTLDAIAAALTVVGSGTDSLAINDSGSSSARIGTLTATHVTGLGMSTGVTYSGISTLGVTFGSGGSTFTVINTNATTTTNLFSTNGSDGITIQADAGATNVSNANGKDTVLIQTTQSPTSVTTTGSGSTATTLGKAGIADGIAATVTINGKGLDSLTIDDSQNHTAKNATITATTITGVAAAKISYSGLASLTTNFGLGNDVITIASTTSGTTTNVNGDGGNNTVTVQSDAGPTNINAGASVNSVTVAAAAGITTITDSAGSTDTVIIGNANLVTGITSTVNVIGNGNTKLNVSDSADATGRTTTLGATSISGLSAGTINYSGLASLSLTLGTANDVLTIADTSATVTNVNTGPGNDSVTIINNHATLNVSSGAGTNHIAVQNTSALATITSGVGAIDLITVGNAGITDGIQAGLTIVGNAADSLTIDDSANMLAKTATLSATSLVGLSPATINFSGLSKLTVNGGAAGNTITVASTAAATSTTINGGAGNDNIAIRATTGALAINTGGGINFVNVGGKSPNVLSTIAGALTVSGGGTDSLTLDDTGDTVARTALISATKITGLGMGTAGVSYSGIATLTLSLDKSGNTVDVTATAHNTNTVLSTGAGTNAVVVGSKAPTTTGGTLANIAGSLSILGSGKDSLTLDNSADTAIHSNAFFSADSLTGVAPGNITFSGQSRIGLALGGGKDSLTVLGTITGTTTLSVGNGNDTVNIQSDSGTTTLALGTGTDIVNLGTAMPGTGGNLAGITAPLTITAGGHTTLNLDDGGATASKTIVLGPTSVTGLSPASITYSGLNGLNLNLGSGANSVRVSSTGKNVATSVNEGSGNDSVTVVGTSAGLGSILLGTLAVNGSSGQSTLTIDDSLDATSRSVGVTPSTITGLGAGVTYLNQTTLITKLGNGNDTLTVNGLSANTTTSFSGGNGTDTAVIKITGNQTGSLTLTTFESATVSVGGSLTGIVNVTGNLNSITVVGGMAGNLTVSGKLSALTFGGSDTGNITAASIGTINATGATPTGPNGVVLSVTQGSTLRQILATPASGSQGAFDGTVGFHVLYDGSSAANPQAAVRVTTAHNQRFDLELTAPVGQNFDLARLDSTNGAATNLRNVVVEGSLLKSVTASETAAFGYAAGTIGGVYLPADNIAAVSVWGNINANTIRVVGIEGVAFATMTDSANHAHAASTFNTDSTEATLLTVLAVNPTTKKYYESVNLPTETINVAFNRLAPVALFVDGTEGNDDVGQTNIGTNGGDFEEHGMIFTDEAANSSTTKAYVNSPITASVTFDSSAASHTTTAADLAFSGFGASVDSTVNIQNISSTGPLGDLSLRGNGTASLVKNKLNNISAPSIFGKLNLFGGSYTPSARSSSPPILSLANSNAVSASNVDAAPATISLTLIAASLYGSVEVKQSSESTSDIVTAGDIASTAVQSTGVDGQVAGGGMVISGVSISRIGALNSVGLSGGIA